MLISGKTPVQAQVICSIEDIIAIATVEVHPPIPDPVVRSNPEVIITAAVDTAPLRRSGMNRKWSSVPWKNLNIIIIITIIDTNIDPENPSQAPNPDTEQASFCNTMTSVNNKTVLLLMWEIMI